MSKQTFWIPTRPYNLIAAINRAALATGSARSAMISQGADYNGHQVNFVEPNQFKPYWTCYYTWAGICTIGRGTLEDCLRAARREFDRGALGASAFVTVETEEDAAACLAAGFEPWSKEIEDAHNATWRTLAHDMVHEALHDERTGFFPGAVGILANCKTAEEYKEKRRAYGDELREARRKAQQSL